MSQVLIALAGEFLPSNWEKVVLSAKTIIAADGGANQIASVRTPDYIVGDGDSIHDDLRNHLLHDDDQDTTDCEKALRLAEHLGFREGLVLGLEGSRIDHVLASLASCAASALRIEFALMAGNGLIVHESETTGLETQLDQVLSVLPLGECEVTLTGVRWPMNRALLTPKGPHSISNRALGISRLTVHRGSCLVVCHDLGTVQT